ncbi:EPIDERMAL PATTERNING FACTOR-like protein [Tasmannia lanceolata]|uniref:EPIDERMAL PATTERNING FACTOR-like protein n=1 Tax=Tasmannia lanceolata TaxID=3420 RepID=UPI00406499A6
MGCSHNFIFTHRHCYLLISLLLLNLSLTQMRFMAEGRLISTLLEVGAVGDKEEKMLVRARIGSRPPSCERRCVSCGHCEAVQVPAIPQEKSGKRHSNIVFTTNSRGEDTSNYKPMNWKCKCGNMIFNP